MIVLVLLCLALILAPTKSTKPPTGCVTIQSLWAGDYITHSYSRHDNDRRHVSLYMGSEVWNLIPSGKYYRIRHRELNEELYESEQYYNGNYIFTWIPKNSVSAGEWEIRQSRPKFFFIKNVKFGHCLSITAAWSTWIGAYETCEPDGMNEWKIQSVECK